MYILLSFNTQFKYRRFHSLSVDTYTYFLFQAFIEHGEIEEGAVIYDKATGKSRGYGFITYKHMESTHEALRAPSKLIDVSLSPFCCFDLRLS